MRLLLRNCNQKRLLFSATIARTSVFNKNGILQDSILLKNLKILGEGVIVADHVWIKKFPPLNKYKEGETIQFFATVRAYVHSNEHNTVDYGLTNLAGFKLHSPEAFSPPASSAIPTDTQNLRT